MHIDSCTTTRHGKTYRRHLLRTSYREKGKVKKRTLANLSQCSEEEIAAIRLALQHKADLSQLGSAKPSVEIKQGLSAGAVLCVYQIAQRLGIVSALGSTREGKLALWQVMARVIDQGSRLSAVRLAQQHAGCEVIGLQGFHEDHLYKNLKWVWAKQDQIEDRLYRRRYDQDKPDLLLYDVTSAYLEGQQNALGAFGYNRDKKQGKQQIVIGLMCDVEGEPITVQAFAGNTSDTKTFGSQVKKVAVRFGGGSITFVGDRGMIKGPQINELREGNFHFITALTKPQIEKLLKAGTLQLSLFDEDVAEVHCQDNTRLILRRNPVRMQEIRATRAAKRHVLEQCVAHQNDYLHDHAKAKTETALKKVNAMIRKLKLSWLTVDCRERTLTLRDHVEARQEIEKLDGCYAIKTDLLKEHASKQIVHDRYKDLALVEQGFRTSKTAHLEMRPIYVRCEESTRAHVFIVMLAYKIIRELTECWKALDLTVEEGLQQLTTLCAQTVTINDSQTIFNSIPTPNDALQRLLSAANISIPEALPKRTAHVVTRKQLSSERK